MPFNGLSYSSLTEFLSKLGEKKVEPKADCLFAHPVEGAFADILKNSYVRKVLNGVVEKQYIEVIDNFYLCSKEVTKATSPLLFGVLEKCCERIGLTDIPCLVLTDQLQNIYALTIGSDRFSFIALSRMAAARLSEEELLFLIGHECGHLFQNNITVHTVYGLLNSFSKTTPVLSDLVSSLIEVPINFWHRCSEITADRAGLICCYNLQTAQRMLIGAENGFDYDTEKGWEEYVESFVHNELSDIEKNYFELDSKHPLVAKRLKALEYFSDSKMYQSILIGKVVNTHQTISNEELENRINKLLK